MENRIGKKEARRDETDRQQPTANSSSQIRSGRDPAVAVRCANAVRADLSRRGGGRRGIIEYRVEWSRGLYLLCTCAFNSIGLMTVIRIPIRVRFLSRSLPPSLSLSLICSALLYYALLPNRSNQIKSNQINQCPYYTYTYTIYLQAG